jgi:hypothetical protein
VLAPVRFDVRFAASPPPVSQLVRFSPGHPRPAHTHSSSDCLWWWVDVLNSPHPCARNRPHVILEAPPGFEPWCLGAIVPKLFPPSERHPQSNAAPGATGTSIGQHGSCSWDEFPLERLSEVTSCVEVPGPPQRARQRRRRRTPGTDSVTSSRRPVHHPDVPSGLAQVEEERVVGQRELEQRRNPDVGE